METPPLPLIANFYPSGRRLRHGLDVLLKRLQKAFPELVAEPKTDGMWAAVAAARKITIEELEVRLTAAGVAVRFALYALPGPTGDVFFEVAQFDPADANSIVAASSAIADALGFGVSIVTFGPWGIQVIAERNETPRSVAVGYTSELDVKLRRYPKVDWPEACRRAAAAWCKEAETLRPSLKKAMLKTNGGPAGVADTLLRDLAAFGPMNAWYEARDGSSHENLAILRSPPWTIAVSFAGAKNGKLRKPK